jgi:tRNA-Thr(GGU) m(6)t(6)A37 methyltransferase TsaA
MREIGAVHCEFPEKFGVPKQPGLAPSLKARLVFDGEWAQETYWRGITECSHLWVIFQFHLNGSHVGGTVRPPILGGQERMGVFATRSPHRPNPIGLSLVKVEAIRASKGRLEIEVSGHDFVDGTPVLDLKPYIASHDTPNSEAHHWTDGLPRSPHLTVRWQGDTKNQLGESAQTLEEVLALDPRPRQAKAESVFGLLFKAWNVTFKHDADGIQVLEVEFKEHYSDRRKG